jgi:hypothetical protein
LWLATLGKLRVAYRQMYHLRNQPNLLGAVSGWLMVTVSAVYLSAGKSARSVLIDLLQKIQLCKKLINGFN